MSRFRLASALAVSSTLLLSRIAGAAGHPNGASLVRLLGPNAGIALSPSGSTSTTDGLVRLPQGVTAESVGLEPVVPGFARLRGGATAISAFALAHPELPVEISPPLHTLLDKAGLWTNSSLAHLDPLATGAGVLVGVADTGLDVLHADFLDPVSGNTRVVWMLDLSAKPFGRHADLEQKYGVKDQSGKLVSGAVFSGADLDQIRLFNQQSPSDQVGHGTHVTSIATGNGGAQPNHTPYVGVAPSAGIVFARITRDGTDSIDNGDLVRGVQFLFDLADQEKKPIAVNLSLGSDFGPHDGTSDWEETLASYVGPDKPGHALVAAAGNSGSILDAPVHQSVRVTPGARMRVPITTKGALSGALEVWVAMRSGASLSVGLDGPDGEWIPVVPAGQEKGKNQDGYNSGVINGSNVAGSPIPAASHGAVVVISGAWPSGQYAVTLEGEGTADLFLEGTGDVSIGGNAGFVGPVREGTINLPATNPSVIGVGCTVNRAQWTSIDHSTESQAEPVLDAVGGLVRRDPSKPTSVLVRDVQEGEICWFSSAGPTLTGVPKPEIAAPGGIVVAAMSRDAHPGAPSSIFTTSCPPKAGQAESNRCLQVDATHGVSQGTSMSAPMVAGTIALLFERDPTLTQDKIVGLLQAGAHPFRGDAPFDDQSGPGELDVTATLDALDQTWQPKLTLPSAAASWITASTSYVAADGSTPLTAIIELRTEDAKHRADLFDAARLQPVVTIDGVAQPPPTLVRRAPGVWFFTLQPPAGRGGSTMTIGATFDGEPIVTAKSLPIAADVWRAEYASAAKGGCGIARGAPPASGGRDALALLVVACACARRRRARRNFAA